jgi:hypothetical protein
MYVFGFGFGFGFAIVSLFLLSNVVVAFVGLMHPGRHITSSPFRLPRVQSIPRVFVAIPPASDSGCSTTPRHLAVASHVMSGILLVDTCCARLKVMLGLVLFGRAEPACLQPLGLVALPRLLSLHPRVCPLLALALSIFKMIVILTIDRGLGAFEDGKVVDEATCETSGDGGSPRLGPPTLLPHV